MQASTGGDRKTSQPSALDASVRLWASVKAVIVPISRRLKPTSSSKLITNNKWSTPVRMCSTPSKP